MQPKPTINLTPLISIALVLIVLLMVTPMPARLEVAIPPPLDQWERGDLPVPVAVDRQAEAAWLEQAKQQPGRRRKVNRR